MFGVNGKIERLFLFDPLDSKRQWAALSLLPSWSFHEWGVGRTIHVGEHINARTVHCPSLSSTPTTRFAFNAAAPRLRQSAATNRATCSRRSKRSALQCTPAGTR